MLKSYKNWFLSNQPGCLYAIRKTADKESFARIGSGIVEMIAALLTRLPGLLVMGPVTARKMMAGAIFFRPWKIGIYFDVDPVLFIYAVTFVCCAALIFVYWNRLRNIVIR